MKENFIKANLPVAKGFLLTHSSQLQEALDYVGFPAIIKPYDFGGSGGVILAHNFVQAQSALAEAQKLIATHKKNFGIAGDKYLIEEYIDSEDEVSVEVICYNNQYKVIAITEKYLSPKPWFSEMAHIVPSHRNANTALRTLAKQACKALDIEFGLAHVEIKIKDGAFYIIEAAARPGGDGIMDQIERSFGLNPYALHISAYLGNDVLATQIPNARGTAGIAFLKAPPGRIEKIKKPSTLELDEHITSLEISAKIGQISVPPHNWSAREGIVEFYWPGDFETYKSNKILTCAETLSQQIFTVNPNESE